MGEAPASADVPTFIHDFFVCPGCEYNLFGIEHTTRCPECGLDIDRAARLESQLPWTHRHGIGYFRAFVTTAGIACFNPRKLAAEMHRPVSHEDARKFRHACIVLAWLPMFSIIIWMVINLGIAASSWQWLAGMLAIAVALWIHLLVATGIPSLFFVPADLETLRQNRAVALSYYASAPLALTFILASPYFAFVLLSGFAPTWVAALWRAQVIVAISAILFFGWFALLILCPSGLLKYTLRCSPARYWTMAVAMFLAWTVLFAVIAGGIPMALLYITIGIKSLWP